MLYIKPWQITSIAIAALVVFPLLTLVILSFDGINQSNAQIWSHLSSTVLNDYIKGSLTLMLGVAVLTLLLGIGSAWLVTQYQFKGVVFFNWALLLPLAMPTYIIAYSYTGLLEIAGPVQSLGFLKFVQWAAQFLLCRLYFIHTFICSLERLF